MRLVRRLGPRASGHACGPPTKHAVPRQCLESSIRFRRKRIANPMKPPNPLTPALKVAPCLGPALDAISRTAKRKWRFKRAATEPRKGGATGRAGRRGRRKTPHRWGWGTRLSGMLVW